MKWKRFLFDNLPTKLMAIVLAFLLWIYLYNESTESGEFTASFTPTVMETGLASCKFYNESGQEVTGLQVGITGPKGDLRGLSKKGIRFEPRFEKALFTELFGTIQRDLTANDLNLPENFRVTFKSSPRIYVRYVKYTQQKVKLNLATPPIEGEPAVDFAVKSVRIINPPDFQADVRMPADRIERNKELTLRRVALTGGPSETLTVAGRLDTPDESIQLKSEVVIEVRIELQTEKKQFDLPLVLAGENAVTRRLELQTRTVKVEISGRKSALEKLESKSQLFAYVIATDADIGTRQEGERFSLRQVQCQVLDDRIRGDLTVTVMPGVKEEDRVVDVKLVK